MVSCEHETTSPANKISIWHQASFKHIPSGIIFTVSMQFFVQKFQLKKMEPGLNLPRVSFLQVVMVVAQVFEVKLVSVELAIAIPV